MPTLDNKSLGLGALRVAACAIFTVLPLSLVIFTHQRELTPLYGSGPTSYSLYKIAFVVVFASSIQPFRTSLRRNSLYAALSLTLAPNATYWIAVWSSRWKNPVWGPAFTHATVLGPLVFVLTTFVVEIEALDGKFSSNAHVTKKASVIVRIIRGGISFAAAVTLARRLWAGNIFYNISDSQIYLSLAGLFYSLWILSFSLEKPSTISSSSKKKKKKFQQTKSWLTVQKMTLLTTFGAVWWGTHPYFANPILPHPLYQTFTHPTFPLQILSAEQSITGLITVGQLLPAPDFEDGNEQDMHSVRYLRASHSLLGGVWTHNNVHVLDEPPISDSFGVPLGDSIYTTFVLQDAVRLVNSTTTGKEEEWRNALIIGLGAGISATAFMRHNIPTTIVEIDPAVYKAARTFFGLPDPTNIFLEDAREWAAKKRAKIDAGHNEILFDIVVHDCFSGGGVPEHIYTMEFWSDLKGVMQPDGLLVVNYAGIFRSESSKLIVNTLERSFGPCRAFHDMSDTLTDQEYDTEFINVVLFCTRSSEPLSFRETRNSDWLGSPLRRYVLQSLAMREINLETIRSAPGDDRHILEDHRNPLGALQEEQGSNHWLLMRQVLPDIHWETY